MITIHFYVLGKKEVRTWRNVTGADSKFFAMNWIWKFNSFGMIAVG